MKHKKFQAEFALHVCVSAVRRGKATCFHTYELIHNQLEPFKVSKAILFQYLQRTCPLREFQDCVNSSITTAPLHKIHFVASQGGCDLGIQIMSTCRCKCFIPPPQCNPLSHCSAPQSSPFARLRN